MNKMEITKVEKILKTTEAKNGQVIKFLDMKEVSKPNKYEITLNDLIITMKKTLTKYSYDDIVNLIIDKFDELMYEKTDKIDFSVNISNLSDITNIRKLTSSVLAACNLVAVQGRFGIANVIILNSKMAEILKDKISDTEFIIVESLDDRIYLYRRNNTIDSPNLLFCYDEESDLCDLVKVGNVVNQVEVVYLNR
jgi:hypothetical protein